MRRVVWKLVWLCLFKPTPRWMFHSWRRFLLRVFGAKIAKGVRVSPSCWVSFPWNLSVGEHSWIGVNVVCDSIDNIMIGNHVVISQGGLLCCTSCDYSSALNMKVAKAPVIIESQVWIAARVFVGPGVTIGEGAVVGACAVVTKSITPWTVVGGNPAQFIKQRVLRED